MHHPLVSAHLSLIADPSLVLVAVALRSTLCVPIKPRRAGAVVVPMEVIHQASDHSICRQPRPLCVCVHCYVP
jgi:hypothetical protein